MYLFQASQRLQSVKLAIGVKVSTSACVIKSMKESTTGTLLQSPEERDNLWVKIKDISLKINDRNTIEQGLELTDLHINSAQRLIKNQLPKLNGLKLSLLQAQPLKGSTINAIQIFHIHGNHWIVAATRSIRFCTHFTGSYNSSNDSRFLSLQ